MPAPVRQRHHELVEDEVRPLILAAGANRALHHGLEAQKVLCEAHVHADRLPRAEWAALPEDGWPGVLYNGDRIEMWTRRLERREQIYRVVEGWWTSLQPSASYHEEISYVGARRGAMLSAGYRPDAAARNRR